MEKDITLIISDFRNLSSKIYEMVYDDFRQKVKNLDRQRDENVFQQLQARYVNALKKQLEQEAEKVIQEHNRHHAVRTLQRELTGQIAYLLPEFILKVKSM